MNKVYKYTGMTLTMSSALCAGMLIGCFNIRPISIVMGNLGCPVITISALAAVALAGMTKLMMEMATEDSDHHLKVISGRLLTQGIAYGAAIMIGTSAIELACNNILSTHSLGTVIQAAGITGMILGVGGALLYHYGDDLARVR